MFFRHLIQDPQLPIFDPATVPSKKEELAMLKSLPFDELMDKIVHGVVTLTVNLMIAFLVFYLGKFIINKIYSGVRRILIRRKIESSLSSFILSFVRIVLFFILIVTVLGILGIETSSFLALFASAGVAIGMALSGTLQNFAGGVLILLLKPYRVGNYIETQGFQGTVKEIQIFHTVLLTPDNKAITIPNGGLSTGTINNWSRERFRRVDWVVGISYGDSVDDARTAILDILHANCYVVDQYTTDFKMPDECTDATDKENCNDSTCGSQAKASSANYPSENMDTAEDPDSPTYDSTEGLNPQEDDTDMEAAPRKSFLDFFRSKKRRLMRLHHNRINKIEAMVKPMDCSPSVVVTDLGDSSVNLKVRAWVPTPLYWTVYYEVMEQLYKELPLHGIHFPFPQLDVHCIPQSES